MLSINWDAEFSKHEGDVQAQCQWDIFRLYYENQRSSRTVKKVMSERTKKYPVPLNVKIRA